MKPFHHPKVLFLYYLLVNMVPSASFFFSQPLNRTGKLLILIFPLGCYLFLLSLFKNTGKGQVLLFPLFFLHAFQIVLFYLLGIDVIAVDMFLNVFTTNMTEISELLGSLLPAILLVILLYVPPTVLAAGQWIKHIRPQPSFRKMMLRLGIGLLFVSLGLSFFSKNKNTGEFAFHEEIYPADLFYNLGLTFQKIHKTEHYNETSKDFSFHATRKENNPKREIVVLVIGETGRADNWQLFGYQRETNPLLSRDSNLVFFKDALTESNVTHKSVPIFLSAVGARDFKDIYDQKSIFEAFKEAGFTTICLSNQAENSSFIEFFSKQADIYKTIRVTDPVTHITTNPYDEALNELLKDLLKKETGSLFIVLHTYGSHFNYNDRYPENFRKFRPDRIENVSRKVKKQLVNAYDNTILYTDFFLSETIKTLDSTRTASFLLYSSDHGEDLFDDRREKFLHSSPTPTYYQLHIPFLTWFSTEYEKAYPDKIKALEANKKKGISTNVIFHTLLDVSDIETPYLKTKLSLVSRDFELQNRYYLNDHDHAIPLNQLNFSKEDLEMFKRSGIRLSSF